MRFTRSTRALQIRALPRRTLRGVALSALLTGLGTACAAPAAALAGAAASAASSVVHQLTASAPAPGPAASAMAASKSRLTPAQLKGRSRAITIAQREAHRRGWTAMSVASTSFESDRWEVSLLRLPALAEGHALALVSPEGELLDFRTSDS
jgi:hypothetical protein